MEYSPRALHALLIADGSGRKNKKRKHGGKRKTRGQLAGGRGPSSFAKLLEEVSSGHLWLIMWAA
jgi:hypothetical protein